MKRYELEEAIMEAWDVEGELNTLISIAENCDKKVLITTILGIKHITNARFNKLFRLYEEVCFNKEQDES